MKKNKSAAVLPVYIGVFYTLWAAWELWGKGLLEGIVQNDVLRQLISSGLIKNLVWTLPAILLVRKYEPEIHIALREMFTARVRARHVIPPVALFTLYILAGSLLQKGELSLSDEFGWDKAIIVLFVGITEEAVFRGWLLNATVPKMGKWQAVSLNAAMFLAIHFPSWLMKWVFIDAIVSFDFLCVVVLSVIFSLSFLKSRSLLPAIILHMYWDLLAFMFF